MNDLIERIINMNKRIKKMKKRLKSKAKIIFKTKAMGESRDG